jgi:hypothetical protein
VGVHPKYHNTTPPHTDTKDMGGADAIEILLWYFRPKEIKELTTTSLVIALIKLWADIDPELVTTYPSLFSALPQRPNTPVHRTALGSVNSVARSPNTL